MISLSPGIAFDCFNLLEYLNRYPISITSIESELYRSDRRYAERLIEFCKEISWIRSNESGIAVLTPRGAIIAATEGYPGKLRQTILDYAEELEPPWVKLAIDGRKRLLSYAPRDVAQCLVEAELSIGHSEPIIFFWDQLAAIGRGQRGVERSEIGRHGERLSLEYERNRTGREPEWRSVECNADGYDLLSIASSVDIRPIQIEVKASQAGLCGAMHITRNEWSASELMPLHRFHLWDTSSKRPALAVVYREDVAKHAPSDNCAGSWLSFAVPFSVFAGAFEEVQV